MVLCPFLPPPLHLYQASTGKRLIRLIYLTYLGCVLFLVATFGFRPFLPTVSGAPFSGLGYACHNRTPPCLSVRAYLLALPAVHLFCL